MLRSETCFWLLKEYSRPFYFQRPFLANRMESRGARSRHRKFYELPPEENGLQANGEEAKAERNTLTEYINSSVIGNNATFLRWVDHLLSQGSLKIIRLQPLWKENCLILRLHCLWSQS